MIQIVKDNGQETVAIKIDGNLTAADYDEILPVLESRIRKYDKINLYCEVSNVEKVDPEAIWKDLKFDVRHYNHFRKIAMVGSEKWVKWLTKLSKPFTTAEVKFFKSTERDQAWNWLTASVKERA